MASHPAVLEVSSIVKIKIGEHECLVNVNKIPYFAAFTRFQSLSGQSAASVPVHDEIPHFTVINECVDIGYRNFFLQLPLNLEDYHTVCETLDFLTVDVLKGQKLRDVFDELKQGKSDVDDHGKTVKGQRRAARDAAFKLLYLFILGEFESDVKDSNMAFNATLFVASHPGIFRVAARMMVRAAFEERFVVSDRQQKGLTNGRSMSLSERGGEWMTGRRMRSPLTFIRTGQTFQIECYIYSLFDFTCLQNNQWMMRVQIDCLEQARRIGWRVLRPNFRVHPSICDPWPLPLSTPYFQTRQPLVLLATTASTAT